MGEAAIAGKKERADVTPERFRLIEEVFLGALEFRGGGGDARAGYLDRACRGDNDLRVRVQALLKQHDPTSEFLEPPAMRHGAVAAPVVGKMVGRYRIVRLIASGGMGAVYEAEQEKPVRRVALKVMRGGVSSEQGRRRFEFESQILASLRHPGIAQVYEAGVHDELGGPAPFFAMELVNGTSITRHCAEAGLALEARLRLMARVCEAVQHAHLRGVIHRDIKPSNILVERESAKGTDAVKVIDFGIARVVAGETPSPTLGTEAGGMLGTLEYMSPEQCTGGGRSVDTRSDVYSLGVVLYELLCGRLPYDLMGASIAETASIICTRPAVRPSAMNGQVRGDIETIVLKALEKEPDRRYESAGELARDIERYLSLEPIDARRPTALYQVRMFARRHRALVGGAVGTALVLVAATGASVTFGLAARREAARAAREEQRADRRADFLQGALASANPWFPPSFPEQDLSDYEPWDEWQGSPWPYAGVLGRAASVTDVVMAAVLRVPSEFADDPETRARLSDTLGWTLQRLLSTERHPAQARMLERAEALLRDALQIRRGMKGEEHEDTIRSMMRLAEFLDYTPGGIGEGGELYDEAYRTCVRVYGPHDARTLHALRGWVNNQSFVQGRWEAGRQRLEEAVGWAQAPDAEASPPVLISLAYYAFLCSHIGDCERTGVLVERSTRGLEALVGERDIRSAFALQYCAQAMEQCGRHEEAERHMRAALAGQRAFFGEKSLEAAIRLASLGEILTRQRRWVDAADVQRESYELFLGIRGPAHGDTLWAQWQLAETLWFGGGEREEAERLALAAYDTWTALNPKTHPRSLWMAQRLAEGGLISEKYAETIEFLDEQSKHAVTPGVDASWTEVFAGLRAQCLAAMGRKDEAMVTIDRTADAARASGATAERIRRVEEIRARVRGDGTAAPTSSWPR